MESVTEQGVKIAGIRRSARVFAVIAAVLVALIWLLMIAEGLDMRARGHAPGPNETCFGLAPLAAIWFGLIGIYAVAMSLALKWERAAVLVSVAVLLGAHVDGLFLALFEYPGHLTTVAVVNPLLLPLWVPVLLYLLCWRLERRTLRPRAEASLPDKA
jgi:hypothetical protein